MSVSTLHYRLRFSDAERFFRPLSGRFLALLALITVVQTLRQDGSWLMLLPTALLTMLLGMLLYALLFSALLPFFCGDTVLTLGPDGISETLNGRTKHYSWHTVRRIETHRHGAAVFLGKYFDRAAIVIPERHIAPDDLHAFLEHARRLKQANAQTHARK